ncbi:DUF3718 domain-containing protein [Bowmanella sp. JS7-9]|uniref:DUF3718 domain-containing protein n=1 Tax=Pseudobowmanella zhangzhouensis TaxID=1537679 RepID=A0ABW1XI27_9ALTE|nr:DUF3718 domain-containing protein [Bowmanella sp. JS7-9]TBX20763.1 hypothetical protein TK45_13305 [Bowmanella sp. JS7-9]
MKAKLITCALALTASLSASASSIPQTYLETQLVGICESIRDDHVGKFQHRVAQAHLRMKTIREKLVCNQMSAYDFAMHYDSFNVASKLQVPAVSITDLARVTPESAVHIAE